MTFIALLFHVPECLIALRDQLVQTRERLGDEVVQDPGAEQQGDQAGELDHSGLDLHALAEAFHFFGHGGFPFAVSG